MKTYQTKTFSMIPTHHTVRYERCSYRMIHRTHYKDKIVEYPKSQLLYICNGNPLIVISTKFTPLAHHYQCGSHFMIISCKPAYKQLLLGNHGNSAYSLVNSLTSDMCFLSPLGFLSPGCLSSVLFSSVSHETSTKHTSNRPVKGKMLSFLWNSI